MPYPRTESSSGSRLKAWPILPRRGTLLSSFASLAVVAFALSCGGGSDGQGTSALTVRVDQAAAQTDPTFRAPVRFDVVFSRAVTDFGASDVTLSDSTTPGTLVASVSGSGAIYEVAVSGMTTSGTVAANIAAGRVHDASGEANAASTSTDGSVTYDPSVLLADITAVATATHVSPIHFSVLFSSPVHDFVASDATLSDSTAPGTLAATVTEGVPADGMTYDVAVSGMTGEGSVIVNLGAGVAHNDMGVGNSATSTGPANTVTYDTTPPTVTINQAVGQADPVDSLPIRFTVVFSDSVNGFAGSDVAISGTAGGTPTATVTEVAPNDGTTYTVAVTGLTSAGTVSVTIPAGSAHNAAGNANLASTSIDNTVSYF